MRVGSDVSEAGLNLFCKRQLHRKDRVLGMMEDDTSTDVFLLPFSAVFWPQQRRRWVLGRPNLLLISVGEGTLPIDNRSGGGDRYLGPESSKHQAIKAIVHALLFTIRKSSCTTSCIHDAALATRVQRHTRRAPRTQRNLPRLPLHQ